MTLATLLLSAVIQLGPLASAEGPNACEPTACTDFSYVEASGYLYCQESAAFWGTDQDEQIGSYPPGQWRFVAGEPEDMALNLMSFGYAEVSY